MNIVLLQSPLSLQDIEHLLHEFPHYLFLSFTESSYKNLSQDNWSQVEILYGCRLTEEELAMAPQLRWIHCPSQELNKLCLPAIEDRGNLLLTAIKEENLNQIGEFVLGGILAISKNMFHWKDADLHPNVLWDSKWRENMWTLKGKNFLQIGIDKVGSEIARRASQMDMRVTGASPEATFHPHCSNTCSFSQLHAHVPQADIVCLSLPRTTAYEGFFGKAELALMKEGSILIILGNPKNVDEEALVAMCEAGKFRGVLLDAMYQTPIPPSSPLWKAPNMLITPDVAPRPKAKQGASFATFRYNLRQYVHGNFKDMRNVLNKPKGILS